MFYLGTFFIGLLAITPPLKSRRGSLERMSVDKSLGGTKGAGFLLAIFSVLGVPPLLGFLGKFVVILRRGALSQPCGAGALILGAMAAVYRFILYLGSVVVFLGGAPIWVRESPLQGNLWLLVVLLLI